MLKQQIRHGWVAVLAVLTALTPCSAVGANSTQSTTGYEVIYVKQNHPIQPASISRPAGPVVIVIKNLTKLSTLNFTVITNPPPANASANPAPLASAVVDSGSLTLTLNLPAGHYVLVEQNNPQYRVTLEMK